ncbi:MAG: TetR/AcrR family transcriptional regulator [Flavobacteriaceae bacterium]|nr:TetR/AcrR family transcriptional regulator [Flavobacteriaceae bacterium]
MRENILNKSKELFLKHGFKTVGMDDISNELGISKKTLYQYFSSKDELVETSLNHMYDMVMQKIKAISGTCETPIHEHYEINRSVRDLFGGKISYIAMFQLKKYYPQLAQEFQEKRYKDNKVLIQRNLQEGIEKGYYRKEININFIITQFITGSLAFFYDEEFPIEKIAGEKGTMSCEEFNWNFLEYYLRAIVTPKGLEILENILNSKEYEI